MDHVVRPRNVDGRITAPPGYELRSDGLCYLIDVPIAEAAPASPSLVEQTIADALPIELPMTSPSAPQNACSEHPSGCPEGSHAPEPESESVPDEPTPESPQQESPDADDSADEHSET